MNNFTPPKYTSEDLLALDRMISNVSDKLSDILILPFAPKTSQGVQFYNYGIQRRLQLLIKENYLYLTESFPPSRIDGLTHEESRAAALHLNSFYVHLWGCIDNLAWLIAYELKFDDVNERSSQDVENKQLISLFPIKNKSENLRKWIKGNFVQLETQLSIFDDWIKKLGDLRHPAAHRIPLQLVPYILTTPEQAGNWETMVEKYESQMKKGIVESNLESFAEAATSMDKLRDCGQFFPIFTHELKFNEDGGIVGASLIHLYPTIIDDCDQLLNLVEKCTTFLSTREKP